MGKVSVHSAGRGIPRLAALLALGGLVAALALGLLVRGAGELPAAEAKKKKKAEPNVVVVMTDDQTVESMRIMDTVNSEIGASGTTFANHFTNWAVCCPSRATFLTGQYAHNHGVRGNTAPDGGFGRFKNNKTLATWLQGAGYHTVHIGKFLNGYGGSGSGATFVPPGWSEWYAGTDGTTQLVYDYTLNENGNLIDYGTDAEDFKQDVLTDRAVEVIDRRAPMKKPFFVTVAYTAPHGGGPNPNPQPPTNACTGSAKPAPRHASAFQSEPIPATAQLQRGRRLRQARRHRQQPAAQRRRHRRHHHQLPLPPGIAALGRRGRRRDHGRAARQRRARRDAGRLHLRQRVLPRRAPGQERQDQAL